MLKRHKNADWIKLWADGYSLEWCDRDDHWHAVTDNHAFKEDAEYRVAYIVNLPQSTVDAFDAWTVGFFDCLSNLDDFDFDYWTGWRNFYDINIYHEDEEIGDPKKGRWSVHLMQGYPGNAGYQTLISLYVGWDKDRRQFTINESTYFVGVGDEL